MTVKQFISDYRVFPRGFVIIYFYFSVEIFQWYMALPAPNEAQAAFVMTIGGGLVYAVKAYSTTGIEKFKIKQEYEHTDNIHIDTAL